MTIMGRNLALCSVKTKVFSSALSHTLRVISPTEEFEGAYGFFSHSDV